MSSVVRFIALGALLATAASGAPINVVNHSFELGGNDSFLDQGIYGYSTALPPYGWSVPSGDVEFVQAGYAGFWAAADGLYSVDLNGIGPGSLRQTLSGFTVGGSYELVFSLSANSAWCQQAESCSVQVVIGPADQTFTAGGPAMTFRDVTVSFTATAADLDLTFLSTISQGSGGPVIDNVRVSDAQTPGAETPEPATAWLVAAGAVLLRLRRR